MRRNHKSIIITTKIVFSRSKQAWDGTNLEQLTHIPQHFWWFVWTIISLLVIVHVFQKFILG
ncbi:M50 family metallopeptidase [Staphylococcus warneri]